MRDVLRRNAGALVCAALLVALASSPPVEAQAPTAAPGARKPLAYDAYDYWQAIQGTTLSRDGQWLAYALTSEGADGQLVVRNLETGAEFRHPRGTSPAFTPDGRFVVFTIVPTKAEEEQERQANARAGAEAPGVRAEVQAAGAGGRDNQPRNAAGIMALPGGEVTTVDRVGAISLPEESSRWAAFHRRASGGAGRGGRGARGAQPAARGGQGGRTSADRAKRKDPGSDLVIRDLTTGQDFTIPLVSDFAWSKDGAWLAYAVSSTRAEEDGAFARRMTDGTVRTLQAGKGNYKGLAFDDDGKQLAFVSDHADYASDVAPYRLYYWKTGGDAAIELAGASTRGLPDGLVVSDQYTPRFSNDGKRLYLGTAPPPAPPPPEGAPAPVSVDLWNWRDPLLQPMQRARATQERNRTYRAVVHLAERRFVQLASAEFPTVNPGDDASLAVGTSDVPYQQEISWDASYNDVALVDLNTGRRQPVLAHWRGTPTMSSTGKYLLYFDDEAADWFVYRVSDGTRVNLTSTLGVNFWREDHDTPNTPPAYGAAGWTTGDRSVLLYDKYDIWEVHPDGTAPRMVTGGEGRRRQMVFRYRSLDPDQKAIPTDAPLLLAANDDTTEANGFYRVSLGDPGTLSKVVMLDKSFGAVVKARDADRVVFTLSRFDEFPDLWISDTRFADMTKVSDANPQQSQYVWGHSELIHYTNADGRTLRAILTTPDGFDPSRQYPLMVYIYEELSEGLHTYRAPGPGTSINITRYVSHGYVVLQPDIVYDTGYPGESAEKCVIPAVQQVVARGFIDPKRIGIQGHSWGGYQITHLITRTNMFAAVEAGASVSNMISAYGGIRWGTGMSRAFQYEKTQSRIGLPPWDAPLQYIENSPIFWVKKVQTPYLTIHNDEDDAVPWYQGIEFFSAMRRLGKEAYMFVYNGEPHGLRDRDNQKHWTVHMDEFFDHFLLGAPEPAWMQKGVPFLERGTRNVSDLFKRKDPGSETSAVQR